MSTTTRRTYQEMLQLYAATLTTLAQEVDQRYRQNLNQRLYLVGQKIEHPACGSIWGHWEIGDDDSDLLCVHGQPLPRNLTVEGLYQHLRDITCQEGNWIFTD